MERNPKGSDSKTQRPDDSESDMSWTALPQADDSDNEEWFIINESILEEPTASGSGSMLLTSSQTSIGDKHLLVKSKRAGETYIIERSPSQSTCSVSCHKPIGCMELKLLDTHNRVIGSRWAFGACCRECHRWQLWPSHGAEGPEAAKVQGWTRSAKRVWRCPCCST